MSHIQDDSPDVARCASVVKGFPNGIRCTEIAALLVGFSKDKVSRLLTINHRLGALRLWGALWVDPQFYDSLQAAKVAEAKRIKHVRQRDDRHLKTIKKREPPPPPRKANRLHAPNSVWQLKDFLCDLPKRR